jgi:16S rRNA (cytosine1402-N4)-methyltransferase
MFDEVVSYATSVSGSSFFDCTLGGGGHSLGILGNVKKIKLVCCDTDTKSLTDFINDLGIEHLKEISSDIKSGEYKKNTIYFANTNFRMIKEICKKVGVEELNCIIADLGWSSVQLDTLEGLSFENKQAELDMRSDKSLNIKASDLLNALGVREIESVLMKYSDFNKVDARILSKNIIEQREDRPYRTVEDLTDAIDSVIHRLGNRAQKNIMQTRARVFQALRIAVNTEYENLEQLLIDGNDLLSSNGRMIILTFHSGEHKIIEDFIEKNASKIELLSGNKMGNFDVPTSSEIRENRRSRSARLWVWRKI